MNPAAIRSRGWRFAVLGAVCAIGAVLGACGGDGDASSDASTGGIDAASNAPDADPNAPDADPNAPDADPNAPDARILPDAIEQTCTPVNGTNLALQLVVSGLNRPVFMTSPPGDERLFVVEQRGTIRIVQDDTLVSTPFLDLQNVVRDIGNEQGLLGLAFHPDFANNGRFFVNYTATTPRGDTVIAEYKVSADAQLADLASERRLMVIDQPYSNHNGGMLAFGPDGYLYIGMGDGGNSNDNPYGHGQNNQTHLGSMLRIDIATDLGGGGVYNIPGDNPYSGSDGTKGNPKPEIWAIGLRNPWRFSFDRDNGDLYIADVGQGAWEEVNVAPQASAVSDAPINYGWNTMEGKHCFSPSSGCEMGGLHQPITEYDHAGGRCSITGGYVYRGSCLPDIQGWYFYADVCSDQVWKVEYPGNTSAVELTSDLAGQSLSGISSFGQDARGELYLTSLYNGRLYRIVAD